MMYVILFYVNDSFVLMEKNMQDFYVMQQLFVFPSLHKLKANKVPQRWHVLAILGLLRDITFTDINHSLLRITREVHVTTKSGIICTKDISGQSQSIPLIDILFSTQLTS